MIAAGDDADDVRATDGRVFTNGGVIRLSAARWLQSTPLHVNSASYTRVIIETVFSA